MTRKQDLILDQIVESELQEPTLSYDEIISDLKRKQIKKEEQLENKISRTTKVENPIVKTNSTGVERRVISPEVFNTKKPNNRIFDKKNNKPKSQISGEAKPTKSIVPLNAQRKKKPYYNENYVDDKATNEEFNVQRDPKNLKVMFLGGVGEIGKNMTVLEYGDDIIIIDAGLAFPNDTMPGIDSVVPDITYLLQNKEKIRGIFITHGHEDHIGGLPYVLNELHCPVYGTRLTLALIQNKLKEHKTVKAKCIIVEAGQFIKAGCFTLEFLHVNHSIAGALGFAINTPVGMVYHTGDFKIDFQSIDNKTTDLTRWAELGKRGVLLLLGESTNVEREGYSMSESSVVASLDELFAKNITKRIIIATFASNIHRIQQMLVLAEKYGRRVAFSGRSMVNNMEVAMRIGEMKYNKDIVIDIDKINKYADNELLIITTGSQGEPMSALTRIASGDFPKIKANANDCIILSSSPIPGNEKAINNTINALYRQGADVIYEYLADVHVSGHAYKEELKLLHSLLKPKFFIPIHGEYKHFKHHKDLAMSLGMPEQNIQLVDIGTCIEINEKVMKKSGRVPSGSRLVDGYGIGELDSNVLKDRMNLSEEGVCVCACTLDRKRGLIKRGPEIVTRGLIYSSEASQLLEEARQVVKDEVSKTDFMKNDSLNKKIIIRRALSSFFNKKTKRNPTILTIVFED